jgi:hypothetical protein
MMFRILVMLTIVVLLAVSAFQAHTITSQRDLIREMTKNPACMGAPIFHHNPLEVNPDEPRSF